MTRIKLAVYVDLDQTPGQFNTAESARDSIHALLGTQIPHYNPFVTIDSVGTAQMIDSWASSPEGFYDFAIEITDANKELIEKHNYGDGEPTVGKSYFIFSTDPDKLNLALPVHIFKKCFSFVGEEKPGQFTRVQEII